MSAPRNIAVIDVGKTNVKLALVDLERLEELAVVTRPNAVRPGPPYPHFDLEGHWSFFLEHLAAFHESHGIDGISVTTHGAAAVLLDAEGGLAAPMLDYEHTGPDAMVEAYDALRPPFAETGSPRLPMGLNLGAQLHWQLACDPSLKDRIAHVVTYPQYWGFRLSGALATDMSSLGCHTDLWRPREGRFSDLPGRLGLEGKIAPPRRATEVLGPVSAEIADRTGGGDSFASGVIAALLDGRGAADAVQWGAAHGILVQECIGDTTMVTRADVEQEVARALKGGGVSALR